MESSNEKIGWQESKPGGAKNDGGNPQAKAPTWIDGAGIVRSTECLQCGASFGSAAEAFSHASTHGDGPQNPSLPQVKPSSGQGNPGAGSDRLKKANPNTTEDYKYGTTDPRTGYSTTKPGEHVALPQA